jgi:predicted AAA+ superfamily ATPase
MFERELASRLTQLLAEFPAVALTGPRQVGKTTLALELGRDRPSTYLDLESPRDLARLSEPELYFDQHPDTLLILDEVQRAPALFPVLRGTIDRRRRAGQTGGQFLLLGSASIDLIADASESLAGRLAVAELAPLNLLELPPDPRHDLWVRGGFPDSLTASSDAASMRWREAFVATYLERDIPALGPRVPAETLRRFWTMLAHRQGSPLNAAQLASALAVSGVTIARYVDLLVDLLLVRRLQPAASNLGKRLARAPKVYVRDSGMLHALLGLPDADAILGHPVAGISWEGYVIEQLIQASGPTVDATYYRSTGGAEIDLVLTWPSGRRWAVEIKRTATPKLSRGFHSAVLDLRPDASFFACPVDAPYPLGDGVTAISPLDLATRAQAEKG